MAPSFTVDKKVLMENKPITNLYIYPNSNNTKMYSTEYEKKFLS